MKRTENTPKDALYYVEFWKGDSQDPWFWSASDVQCPTEAHPSWAWRPSGSAKWIMATGTVLCQPFED